MPMASSHCFVFSTVATSTTRRTLIVSSKIRHRNNYLRPKILKTRTKPYPPSTLPLPPQPIILYPQDNVEVPVDETISGDSPGESGKLENLQVSEAITSEFNDVFGDVSATTVFKYGAMYMVGAFVVQMLYSVWVLKNYYSNKEGEGLEINEKEKNNVLLNGNGRTVPVTNAANVFYVEDKLGMEKKIEEIKVMAREARRIELEKKGEDEDYEEDEDDESVVSSHRIGIEKEIGARLLKLQNRINGNKDSSAALKINAHGNSPTGVARDENKNVNQGNGALLFKKKFKFKSHSTKPTKTPKGFPGNQDNRAKKKDFAREDTAQDYKSDANDYIGELYEDKQVNQHGLVTQKSVSWEEREKFVDDESRAILNHGKNLEEKMETPNLKTEAGVKTKSIDYGGVQENSVAMSSHEVTQSRDSRELRTQNPQGSVEENQDSGPIFGMDNMPSISGSSRRGLAKKNSVANRVKVRQANTKPDIWWLNLRYVLVILMQRGSNGGHKGLYSVKFTSKEEEQSDNSYTVAFEDDADANNFCFLLESFFKDLGDFCADAVPMSIQELNEEIIARDNKVVVVKKRQLQLYAGQPLTDVEMALCSIIEQDQNVP